MSAVVLCIGDRLLKSLALKGSSLGSPPIEFSLFRNPGIAFSIPVPDMVFWPFAAAVFIGLVALFLASVRNGRSAAPLLALIILGAASNLWDRMAYGATIDYLILFGRSAVNIADAMIIAGVLAVLLMARERPGNARSA